MSTRAWLSALLCRALFWLPVLLLAQCMYGG
jgi:hypothetical protein